MDTTTSTATLTGLAGARAMVGCFAKAVGKVAAGRGVSLDEAFLLVMREVAARSPDTFVRLLASLQRVKAAS